MKNTETEWHFAEYGNDPRATVYRRAGTFVADLVRLKFFVGVFSYGTSFGSPIRLFRLERGEEEELRVSKSGLWYLWRDVVNTGIYLPELRRFTGPDSPTEAGELYFCIVPNEQALKVRNKTQKIPGILRFFRARD